MPRSLRLDTRAIRDLTGIYDWVAQQADATVARAYISRIEARCRGLINMPNRGSGRGRTASLRSVPFERSATILYRVSRTEVTIIRVLRRGKDVDAIVRQTR